MSDEERNERLRPDRKPDDSSSSAQSDQAERNALLKRIAIYAVILIAVFLIGFVPMWLTARARGHQLDVTHRELRLSRMQSVLSSTVIDARRGDYEPARQTASDFFTALRTEVDHGDNSALNQTQRESTRPLLTQRDEIITLLARSDPAVADRLSDLYVSYRKAMGNAAPL